MKFSQRVATVALALTSAFALSSCGFLEDSESPAETTVVSQPVKTFTVSGAVSGLPSGESITLKNNGTDQLAVLANGSFAFATPLSENSSYAITIEKQPVGATCSVANNTGAGAGMQSNVSNISIVCSPITFTVGGTVTGLQAGSSITLQNNGADARPVSADGNFSFVTPVAFNGSYSVTTSSPTGMTCSIADGSGTGSGVQANVSNVAITCSNNTYTIGGTVTGLGSGDSITLQNNSGNPMLISSNGSFTFTTSVAFGGSYNVSTSSPVGKTCSASANAGSSLQANVSNVAIICSPITFTVGGTVSGLPASTSVTLTNASTGENLTVVSTGVSTPFTFQQRVPYNASYSVTANNPANYTCTPSTASGSNLAANVSSVVVSCEPIVPTVVFNWVTGTMTSDDTNLTSAGFDSTKRYAIKIVLPINVAGLATPTINYVAGLQSLSSTSTLQFVSDTASGAPLTPVVQDCNPGSVSKSIRFSNLRAFAGLTTASTPTWMAPFAPYTITDFEFLWSVEPDLGQTKYERAFGRIYFSNAANPNGAWTGMATNGEESPATLRNTLVPITSAGLGLSLDTICSAGLTIR